MSKDVELVLEEKWFIDNKIFRKENFIISLGDRMDKFLKNYMAFGGEKYL